MFETLDDALFEHIAATYGPATHAPERLRALADPDPAVAANALYWIEADCFHQDLYCEATAYTVPYLIELVQHRFTQQAALVLLVGRMLRGGADAPDDHLPYAPRAPLTPHEDATRSAIQAAAPVLLALLNAPDPLVRCAAMWTCAGLGPEARGGIEARLSIEPDRRVRLCGWIALSTLQQPFAFVPSLLAFGADDTEHVAALVEDDVLAVLAAASPIDEITEHAFVRLLTAEALAWLPFAEGKIYEIALDCLRRLGREEPRLESILKRVIAMEDCELGSPFGTAGELWVEIVFPAGVPTHARDLTEPQRWALRNVLVNEARGVRLESYDIKTQVAFVDGTSPLDEPLEFDGHTCSVAEHLLASPEQIDVILAGFAARYAAARTFELALALVMGELGAPRLFVDAVVRVCGGTVTLERTLDYLAALARSPRVPEAVFLLASYLTPNLSQPNPSPEALDPLATVQLAEGGSALKPWLRTFSPARRVQLVAPLATRGMCFWPLCDSDALAAARFDQFMEAKDKSKFWVLLGIPSSVLRAHLPDIADAEVRARIGHELGTRDACTTLVIAARQVGVLTLEVMLPQGTRLALLEVAELATTDDLEPIRRLLRDHPAATVTLYPAKVPQWICETLRLELGERLHFQ